MLRAQLRTTEDGGSAHLKAASYQGRRGSGDHPPEKASSAPGHILVQPVLQSLAEAQRNFEHPFISVQLNDVARSLEHSRAALAAMKVLFHGKPQARFDVLAVYYDRDPRHPTFELFQNAFPLAYNRGPERHY